MGSIDYGFRISKIVNMVGFDKENMDPSSNEITISKKRGFEFKGKNVR